MTTPINIGSRRELFVDNHLIEQLNGGAQQRLHEPVPREVALRLDRPWEGNMSGGFVSVFKDNDTFRMYYKGWALNLSQRVTEGTHGEGANEPHPMWNCLAQSEDGIHWSRSELGLVEHEGSKTNNIVWTGDGPEQKGSHGFSPFKDTNPEADPRFLYKAVGAVRYATKGDLYAVGSPDGIHWALMQDKPILKRDPNLQTRFDSENLAFWDAEHKAYRIYFREYRDRATRKHCRDIRTATSQDFIHWSEPEWLDYGDAPDEELYTNQVMPYFRAPHIYVGFPARYVERRWSPAIEALPEPAHRKLRAGINPRYGAALSDGVFMSSRDGVAFKRWGEAFLRPGSQRQGNWTYGDNYQCWGLIETASSLEGAPNELSLFASENYWREPGASIRRYTLRLDGFVSINAPLAGGEIVTKSLTFDGDRLELNMATSAAGTIRVELQNAEGAPIPGFSMDDCVEIIGDEINRTVAWRNGPDVSAFAGQPVRLRFVMKDADLYSMKFQ